MSFAAPLWLAAAALVAVGVVIAHLFSTSVPPRDLLPTVRFVPEGAPLAVLRTKRISDVSLLLLRLLAVTLLGLALAGAHVPRRGPSRVVLVDRSRAVASIAEVRDSVASFADEAVTIAFDSSARRVSRDSLAALTTTHARGSLSAALVAAHRAVASFDDRSGTELVVVSPLASEEVDSATVRLFALWEGQVRVVRVAAAAEPSASGSTVRAEGDEPVAAVIPIAPRVIPSAARDLQLPVRVVRTLPTRGDSAWARDSGGVLVIWPAAEAERLLERRERADTQSGIAAMGDVVVAAFARATQPREGRVLARWLDGEPAATERPLGQGCVREVAISVDAIGDVALRESFRGLVGSLLEPCGGARDFTASVVLSEAKDLQSEHLQIPSSARDDRRFARDDRLSMLLALAALAALVAEQFLRTRRRADA